MTLHDKQAVSLGLRSYSGQVELHAHEYHQIVLPQSGAMEIEVAGRSGWVDWSQGVLIEAGLRHAFSTRRVDTFLVMDVPHSRPGMASSLVLPHKKAFFPIEPNIRHLLQYAVRSLPQLTTGSPQITDAWCTLLLSALSQTLDAPANAGHGIVAKALAYIEERLHTPLSVREIARTAGTSERRLYVLFNRHLGTTPFAHIAALRLNLATDLLRGTSLTIAEIAHRAGYADQSALTHALKKSRHLTPAAWRKTAPRI